MKPENTKTLVSIINALRVSLFTHKSCEPKYDAQQNLSGRTHYVEDDTLRWHHARVNSSKCHADGLLFSITESVALDMHNRTRGTRCVVFDVFGTTVYHPDLENTFRTSEKAQRERDAFLASFDIAAHYKEVLASKLHYAKDDVSRLESAVDALASLETPATA